jgi:ABC-type enterochelin transport system substrate-binding protein
MSGLLRCLLALLIALAAAVVTSAAWAKETVRLRATIEKADGSAFLVKDRAGVEHKVVLSEKPLFVAMERASMADIKPGMFVGSTAMPQADGSLLAVEVHIFPESMRGTGEGHRPWDLKPQSTMTNANVETSVSGVDGRTLTVKYKDGEKKIVVAPDTVVVTYAPGDAKELTSGVQIFLAAAEKQSDGSLKTARITYGRNGLTPPM